MRKRRIISNTIMYIFLSIVLVFTVFPLFYMVMASFKTSTEIMISAGKILPEAFNLDNYKEVWNSPNFDIARLFLNTVIYTVSNVIIQLFLSITAGYVFEVGKFPLKKLIFTCFTSLMFIKTGGIGIYAKFEILKALNIPINLYALIGLALFSVPVVNIFLVRGYMKSLPAGIGEAAKIDGCGFSGVLLKVYLPLLKPIIATILILSFNSYWNDYLGVSYYTASVPDQRTLTVGLMALKDGGAGTQWNLLLAGATLSILPVLVVYAFCSRYFVQGLAAGAVKG